MPTGSIDKRDETPVSTNARLGYAMQNGTGTFDPFFFINNVNNIGKNKDRTAIFLQKPASGENSKNYKYGETFNCDIWSSI